MKQGPPSGVPPAVVVGRPERSPTRHDWVTSPPVARGAGHRSIYTAPPAGKGMEDHKKSTRPKLIQSNSSCLPLLSNDKTPFVLFII